MPALDPTAMTTSHSCCAETVTSAISLWTELEVMDDDEDLYTYRTLDTASAAAAQQQQQHLYQDRTSSRATAVRGCLRAPTILASTNAMEDEEPMITQEVDPKAQWQEEAYWVSFQNAVRSFSDQQARASYSTCTTTVAGTTMMTSGAERVAHLRNVNEDDDTDMSSFQYLHPHVVTDHNEIERHRGEDEDGEEEEEEDGIPPCIPRTVVTPTASIGSHSLKVGSRHSRSSTGGANMSITTSSSASSSSATNPKALPTFAASNNPHSLQQPETGRKPHAPSCPPSNDGQFGEIRRSLRELMAQAAINKKMSMSQQHQQQVCPNSPMSTTAANVRRGDRGYIISTSLAGPSLEEIKGLRWRMKELAEHAAVVANGHKDAEKYVIGLASSDNNNSTL